MNFNRILFQREPDATEQVAVKDYGYKENAEEEYVETEEEEIIAEVPVENEIPEVVTPEVVAPVAAAPELVTEIPQVVPFDWRKEIKAVDRKELLKEAGLDEFEIGLLEYRKATGDLTPYLQAKTVDYAAMSPEQLMRLDIKKNNPGMSDASLDFKFNKEFSTKYYLDRDDYAEDSVEAVYGQEQLRLDSEQKRKQFAEEQAKFKAPELTPDTGASEREAAKFQLQSKQKDAVLNNPVTRQLQSAKVIQFGEGEDSFKFPISNVQPMIDNALSTILNSDTADFTDAEMTNFYQAIAFAADREGFLKAYSAHQKSLGKKEFQSGLQNVTPITNTTKASEQQLTPAQELARNGVW